MNFKQFLLEERQLGKKYITSYFDLDTILSKMDAKYADRFTYVQDGPLKRFQRFSDNPNFNYIFEVPHNGKLFELDNKRDIQKLFQISKYAKDYYGNKIPDEIAARNFNYDEMYSDFSKAWDGYKDKYSTYVTIDFLKKNRNNLKLVGGNAIWHKRDVPTDENLQVPSWVEAELIRYTDDAKTKISKNVREWLKENIKLPYKSIELYRGLGTSLGYENWDIPEMELSKIEKKLYARFSVRKLEDLHVGKIIDLKRGKESSWSTTPHVANVFAQDRAAGAINILAQSTIPAEDVLIDFKALPKELHKKFSYIHQNEVIVDTNKTKAKVSKIWFDKKFIEKAKEWGYTFVPQKGMVKK